MKLEKLFATPLQVRLLETFLEKPEKMFSTRSLAKILGSSPSAIISRLKELTRLGVIRTISINRLKLYQLNLNNPIVSALLEFYSRLKEIDKSENI